MTEDFGTEVQKSLSRIESVIYLFFTSKMTVKGIAQTHSISEEDVMDIIRWSVGNLSEDRRREIVRERGG